MLLSRSLLVWKVEQLVLRTELGRGLRKGSFPFWQFLHLTQLRAGLLIRPGFPTVLVISLYGTNYPKI